MKPAFGIAVVVFLVASCDGRNAGGGGAPVDGGSLDAGSPTPVAADAIKCPFTVPLGYRVECRLLQVAASRPGFAAISVSVAVVKSTGPAPLPDPIVYLEGGPGSSSLDTLGRLLSLGSVGPLAAWLTKRDVVAIDQRGTGSGKPRLDCVAMVDPMTGTGLDPAMMMMQTSADLVRQCRQRLVDQQIDLSQFNTTSNADDVEVIRTMLGYPAWNVLGASYGTRVALELVRRHPDGLRTVILDSVWPPDLDIIAEAAPDFYRSLKLVFDLCAAQATCKQAYPDLEQAFLGTARRLDANPAAFKDGKGAAVTMNGALFAHLVSRFMYSIEMVRILPSIIYAAGQGKLTFFEQIFAATGGTSGASGKPPAIAIGQHLSVMCADEWPFTTPQAVAARAATIPEEVRAALIPAMYSSACPVWAVPSSPAIVKQAVSSRIPALVLTGLFDPVTPPAWGMHAAETLPGSHVFQLPAETHGIFPSPCGPALVSQFVDTPDRRPAPTCLATAGPLVFTIVKP